MPFDRALAFLPYAVAALAVIASAAASAHAVIYKRDSRAAVSWAGVIWLVPFLGALLYLLFGINRIQRRGARLRRRRMMIERCEPDMICTEDELREALGPAHNHLDEVSRVGEKVTGRPLLEGNRVQTLVNGEQAYPEMLKAIEEARESVALLAYIFDLDPAGRKFAEALCRAKARGAEVRVLIDDVGSDSKAERTLGDAGVAVARFLPMMKVLPNRFLNLRNHRKILVADGRIGFTGGMNLRQSHCVETPQAHLEQDVHFRFDGPVVEHLMNAFADDWAFSTSELLKGPKWFPPLVSIGKVNARAVPFDPGETRDTLRWLIVAAIGAARTSIRIVTPYFFPDGSLVTTLNVAAVRGVGVDIIIPEKSDYKSIDWAMRATLWQVLSGGCRVWLSPPPFDHSKLLVVDEAWSLVGSANIDPRSLRLNFELNVECYDRDLSGELARLVDGKRKKAKALTLKDVDGRPFAVKLRDGAARLFSPYM